MRCALQAASEAGATETNSEKATFTAIERFKGDVAVPQPAAAADPPHPELRAVHDQAFDD